MNCPLCDVALKVAILRGDSVHYCPLCGGTWSAACELGSTPNPAIAAPASTGRLWRIAMLTLLILLGSLLVTVPVGAVFGWRYGW